MPGFDKGKASSEVVKLRLNESSSIEILKAEDGFFKIKGTMVFSQG
jgi:hypothetical protein